MVICILLLSYVYYIFPFILFSSCLAYRLELLIGSTNLIAIYTEFIRGLISIRFVIVHDIIINTPMSNVPRIFPPIKKP